MSEIKVVKTRKKKRGRPKKVIDMVQVEKLASIGCTHEEICAVIGCCKDTLYAQDVFSTVYKKGQDEGKMSLRHMQWQKAKAGHPGMLIWLGKQYLGQADKQEVKADHSITHKDPAKMTTSEMMQLGMAAARGGLN